jgi:hypothetical protein
MPMKAIASLLLVLNIAFVAGAATTINSVNRFSFVANIGWMETRGNDVDGAVIGEFACSGFIYAANAGWIHLGNGSPLNGIRYQNNSATDFGVNHDGLGNLRGYAYGANIGWLTFTNRDASGASFDGPAVDLVTGRMRGFIWSANCGWISLSNQFAFVQTDTIRMGADSDSDGIADAWEFLHFVNLSTANGTTDSDGDGFADLSEYLADTDPVDASSNLRVTHYLPEPGGSSAKMQWSSVATRHYRVQKRTELNSGFVWSDAGLGLILPDAGSATTRDVIDSISSQRFFRVEAVRPLSP